MNYKKLFSRSLNFIFIFAVLLVSFFAISSQAQAAPQDVVGWAWSSNIGWIKFDSTPTNGVKVESTTGDMSGYAWSPNIGWIKFGNLGAFPGPGGDAKIPVITTGGVTSLTNGSVTGWIRACAGTASGNCSSMISRTDGWDGWIKLDWDAGNGDVQYNNGNLTGFAWGSDVVGWVKFDASSPVIVCSLTTPQQGCPGVPAGAITATCSINPVSGSVNSGGTVIYTGGYSNGTAPVQYKWNTDPYGSVNTSTYNNVTTPQAGPTLRVKDSLNNESSSINCPSVSINSTPVSQMMWVDNDPLHAKDTTRIKLGRIAKINWDLTSMPAELTSCSGVMVTNPVVTSWTTHTITHHATQDPHFPLTGVPLGTHKIKITCSDLTVPIVPAQSTNEVTITVTSSSLEED